MPELTASRARRPNSLPSICQLHRLALHQARCINPPPAQPQENTVSIINPAPELAPALKQLRLSGILDSLEARIRVGRRHLGMLMLRMVIEALCLQPGKRSHFFSLAYFCGFLSSLQEQFMQYQIGSRAWALKPPKSRQAARGRTGIARALMASSGINGSMVSCSTAWAKRGY